MLRLVSVSKDVRVVVMLTGTLGSLRLLAVVGFAWIFALSSPVWAQARSVELAPGLEARLPEPLAIAVLEEDDALDPPVLVGYLESEPAYFFSASKVKTWERNSVLWRKLEMELRARSNSKGIETITRGRFSTRAGDEVWYRGYSYPAGQQSHRQVYFLLKGDGAIYWISLTMVDHARLDVVVPIVEAVIRRAVIRPGPD